MISGGASYLGCNTSFHVQYIQVLYLYLAFQGHQLDASSVIKRMNT